MGDECTRGCRFCSVKTNRQPAPLDPNEPEHVATAISKWALDYVVLTCVDRDGIISLENECFMCLDLSDNGAAHFAETVKKVKDKKPKIFVECLTGDFKGSFVDASTVAASGLDVFAHNIETTQRLTPLIRDRRATYTQSLSILEHIKKSFPQIITKSSIMLGFGETDDEVRATLDDLRKVGVDCVTIGQFIRPTKRHIKVEEYIHPDKFKHWERVGQDMGFLYVASGPLVRSSYRAGELFIKNVLKSRQVSGGGKESIY